MKKLFTLTKKANNLKPLLLLLLLCVAGMSKGFAFHFSAVCSTGQRLYYNFNSQMELEITYPGTSTSNPWPSDYPKPTGDIALPSSVTLNGNTYPVTAIGDYAFYHCNDLTGNLYIPPTVHEIGEYAFCDCNGFTGYLVIGPDVTLIGRSAFKNCTGFSLISYGAENCADFSIYDKPFEYCLGALYILEDVQRVPAHIFYCASFQSVDYNASNCADLTEDAQPFNGCGSHTLTIGNNVQRIPNYLFHYAIGFRGSLTIPNSVTEIGEGAFDGCTGFTGLLTIPNSVITIGNKAFKGCTGFDYPEFGTGLTTIGDYAFDGCTGFISTLNIGNSVVTIGDYAFHNCTGFVNMTVMPHSVTTIGAHAFEGCTGFKGRLHIGYNVTSIGQSAFKDCSGINRIEYCAANCADLSPSAYPFEGFGECTLTIDAYVERIPAFLFQGCNFITGSLYIPSSVTSIGEYAFRGCSGFTGSLTIPNSVTSIGNSAFNSCSGFTGSLTIGNSVTSIGNYAFNGCSGFTGSLTIGNSVTTIGDYAFKGCSGFTGSLVLPNSLTTIGEYAFNGCTGFMGSLTLGTALSSIGPFAFCNCRFTGSLTLPNTLTTIGGLAFAGCDSFSGSLTIPNSVTSIGNNAFLVSGFSGTLTIGTGVTFIGTNAFKSCTGINQVIYNAVNCADVSSSGKPFENITGTLVIGYGVQRIPAYMFYQCASLTGTLNIPNSVTSIGNYAFDGCSGFNIDSELTIGDAVTSIGSYAFRNCGFYSMRVRPLTPPSLGTNAFYNMSTTIPIYVYCAALEDYQAASGWSGFSNYQCFNYDFSAVCSTGQTLYYTITDADNHYVTITYPGINTVGPWVGYTQPTGNITLPSTVTNNGVTYTVTAIDDYAFSYCTGLTGSLIIPNTVTSIGECAFQFCTGFTGSLVLSNSLTTIGRYAFDYCPNFTGDLTIPNSVTTIGDGAFMLCSGFNGALTIGSSVATIGDGALGGLSNLSSMVVLPETPPTLGTDALSGIPTNIPVYMPCGTLGNYMWAPGWSAFSNYMQCFENLTVYDGTVTCGYVPAYIYYFDDFTRSQFVIPAADLADMAGSSISSMTFYANSSWIPYITVSSADVYLKEVNYTTISAFESKASATTVYSGYFSIVGTGDGGEMTIHFNTPYTYNGGNLLVGVENTEDNGYKSIIFYGQTVTGASIAGSTSSSTGTIPATQRDFIPKTTFGYTPTECSRPIDLTATNITTNSAVLNWTGHQEEYDLRYRKKPLFFEDFENGLPSDWTTIDNDGDGYNWFSYSNIVNHAHSGTRLMASASWQSIALTPDNWLITPLLQLQGTMKVWLSANSSTYQDEHFAIYLSTTGNSVSNFTTVLVPETVTSSVYVCYTADLSAYAGQQGYIAIRHFNCTDMDRLRLDDFGIYNDPDETGEWVEWTYFGPNNTLNELEPGTEYEWQVRGRDCDGDGAFTEWSSTHSLTTLLCLPEDKCELTFTLTDSYGDGWTGNAIRVVDVETNTLLASMSAPSHGLNNTSTTDTITLSVCDGRELSFEWVSGSWPSECSYTVTDNHGNEIFSGSGAMSEPVTYMVNCSGQVIFLTDGNWNDGSNWSSGTVPPAGSDVVIQANAIVPAGYLAEANEVTLDGGSITVADGGQLKHNTLDLMVTMKKNIVPYTDANDLDYYLLAFPFLSAQVPTGMTSTSGSDFYRFDPSMPGAEWRNHRQEPISFVQRRYGYLYANPEPIELSLTGTTLSVSYESTMSYTVDYIEGSGNPFNGWALLGNPFTYNAYVYRFDSNNELVPMPIMMYDAEGELQTVYGGPVAPMQGFFVHVTETTTVYFSGTGLHEDDYVDLGLPSGTLWATFNIGANAPEDYGDYFAWGETQPKDVYKWDTYQHCNGSYNTLTKYCNNSSYGYNGFTDNLTTLLPEDDAATANWGGNWRTPTEEEFQELIDNTTVTWTQQNGVNGRLFTASNGNSLFLPAAGYIYEGGLNDDAGSRGYYWSSSLYTGIPYRAWYLYFGSDSCYLGNGYRGYGQSVRPVRSGVLPEGAIDGKFTINADGGKVRFSQGNLQYKASTDTWRFAEHQYDYIGDANSNISSSYNGYIDLFGWGTSGYDHGANAYQPWSTSTNYSHYYAYGASTNNLYDGNGQADWGYNVISNGGSQENSGWRTLTKDEWVYVFNTRSTTSGIRYAKAKVNNVNGVILLPDNWIASTYALNSANSSDADFTTNTITAEDWVNVLEAKGAVFLPATGFRYEASVNGAGNSGNYWSSSYGPSASAYSLIFYNGSLGASNLNNRSIGQSVRLVLLVE